ncbi:unnamed protein product [Ectocarpus sp. CCAP 1310/34]|nr:unnamed protein product [Ectocarpus sp. CCAP 1310/34]
MPCYEDVVWEDDTSFEWDVRQVPETTVVEGFTTRAVESVAVRPHPLDRQLVMVLPTEREEKVTVEGSRAIARMIALNARDKPAFDSLFDTAPSASHPPLPPRGPRAPSPSPSNGTSIPRVRVEDANLGTAGSLKKQQLVNVLAAFIEDGLFPLDPKRVPACINGEYELPLINEFCTPFAAKQRRFAPAGRRMIRAEIQQLVDRGVIRQSMSPWAAQCLCVKKKDGTLRLCIDWRELNKLLVSDSGGWGDMQTIFDGLKGKKYFTQLDLASGFRQMEIAEKDRYKTAFRDADGMLWEFTRAGFGLTVLAAAFTRRVKSAWGHLSGVFSWLDDIVIASDTWEEHVATLTLVLNRLLAAGLFVSFAKCIFGAASQEFLGMIIDCTGLYPAPSKLARCNRKHASPTHRRRAAHVFGPHRLLARQFVPHYSLAAAPLTNILRNKAFASKRARKLRKTPSCLYEQRWLPRKFSLSLTLSEGMGVLWAVDHFRPYLAVRRFKLVTDCSALTWLFRCRELCPKLHRWATRLMEYDMELEWKAGVEHALPNALSRLTVANPVVVDVDDSFPDDLSSAAAGASLERSLDRS